MATSKTSSNNLTGEKPRTPQRYITTNNSAGKAVFSTTMSSTPPSRTSADGMEIVFCYGTTIPPTFTNDADISDYQHLIANPPGLVIPNGCAARLVDFPPGYTSPMHRTISLNYNFVVQGEVEMVLDSGETRRMGPGDMAVQRAVNHAWRNVSDTQWARITAFVVPAIPADDSLTGTNEV